jgi:hypothetical protein
MSHVACFEFPQVPPAVVEHLSFDLIGTIEDYDPPLIAAETRRA